MIELEPQWWSLAILSLCLGGLHLVFPAMDSRIRRHPAFWMGTIGGVAAGYVVLYMLPKIARMGSGVAGGSYFLEVQMYYVLLGAIVTYLVMTHLERGKVPLTRLAGTFDYTVHGAYTFLVGYAFVELSSGVVVVNVLIALILGLHQLGMNHVLRARHATGFDRSARWILCLLVLAGTATGLVTELPRPVLNTANTFLAGIILVNVIAEELPLQHQQRVPWFLGGVGFYLLASSLIALLSTRTAY